MVIRYSKQAIDWESLEEVEPDEAVLQMLREIQTDPDCTTYASDAEVQAVLG